MTAQALTLKDQQYLLDNFYQIVNNLHEFIEKIQQPELKNNNWKKDVTSKCGEFEGLYRKAALWFAGMDVSMEKLANNLASKLHHYSKLIHDSSHKRHVKALWNELATGYEEIIRKIPASTLPESVKTIKFKHLIPVNYYRNIFHALNGILAVTCYHFFMTYQQAMILLSSLLGIFIFLEITRRMSKKWNSFLVNKVFGLIARPKEHHKINGAAYYLASLTFCAWVFPKAPLEIAILVLGFGDPVANIIGKKFGITKIFKEKSLQGTIAFFVASLIVTTSFSFTFQSLNWPILKMLGLTITTSLAGALIELYSYKVDDNFTILAGCSLIAWMWFI